MEHNGESLNVNKIFNATFTVFSEIDDIEMVLDRSNFAEDNETKENIIWELEIVHCAFTQLIKKIKEIKK